MKAVVIERPGGPEVLALRQRPDPVIGADDVRVRVRATALNRADLLQRRGRYPPPADAPPDVPGLEFAGEVEACGERVRSLHIGDRVMGLLGGGGHAEQVAVHEGLCLPIPPGLSWDEAAAIPEAFLTAYDALFAGGSLAPGEVVLLHAAASGVGTAAAQLATTAGARVIGLSRDAGKRTRLAGLGLDRVLDPTRDDLAARIRSDAGGGVDLVLDLLGAGSLALNLDVLKRRGRLVQIGLLSGSRSEIDLAVLMRKRLTIVGSVLRSRRQEEKIALVREFAARMLPLFAVGRLRPWIDRSLPLERIAEAHELMERNGNFGKIVLRVAETSR